MKRDRLKQVRHFAVHYGREEIRELAEFDLMIVEPSSMPQGQIKQFQDSGALVVAYISVMEVGAFHTAFWSKLKTEDFLYSAGQRIAQPGFDTFLVNLTSSRWQQLLYQHIGQLLTVEKYDGIFLDTIGDVEMSGLPEQLQQIEAAQKLVEDLRRWFPNAILIQNNGLEALCLRTAPLLDAIVWENPPFMQKGSGAWVRLIAERLDNLARQYHLRIMMLFDRAERLTRPEWLLRRRFADDHGYLSYFAPTHYLGTVRVEEPRN